ncbi:MAG: hypothetical protein Ct9H300mP16_03350 [Pseudomonadota bacterium]|nr:MAG: hypothetical protein Ct9H300mP16_03350 [Pseudomonadota bacterium]
MSLLNHKDNDHAFPMIGTGAGEVLERINQLKSDLPSRAHGQFWPVRDGRRRFSAGIW